MTCPDLCFHPIAVLGSREARKDLSAKSTRVVILMFKAKIIKSTEQEPFNLTGLKGEKDETRWLLNVGCILHYQEASLNFTFSLTVRVFINIESSNNMPKLHYEKCSPHSHHLSCPLLALAFAHSQGGFYANAGFTKGH